MPVIQPTLSLVGLAVLLSAMPAAALTWKWDGGAGTGNWTDNANWNPDAPNPNVGGSFGDRLEVNSAQPLVYTAAQGTTEYGAAGVRGLVIGSGGAGALAGTMEITGGIFSTLNANAGDVIGNIPTTGLTSSLIISGGSFIGAAAGTLNNFGGTSQNGIITVSGTGSATFTTLTVSNAAGGTGTVNLDGGTLAANLLNKVSTGTAIVNLNGGVLQARQNNATFMTGLNQANVKAGGAFIDTNTFDITIGQALLDGTGGGGLTKSSAGKLTLTAANTYTGTTKIGGGTLELGSGGTTGSLGAGAIVNDAVFTINRSNAVSVLNDISGSGSLNKLGGGIATMEANTYTGATNIQAGAILATANDTLGTAAAGTTITTNAALGLSGVNYSTAEALTISGPGLTAGSGVFAAVQRGAIQGVSGANTWAGDIVITNTANTRIGVQDGASLTITGSITEQTPGSSLAFRHGNTAGSNIILSGTGNSWSGFTDVFGGGGALILGTDNAIPTASTLRVGTSGIPGTTTLDLNGRRQTVAGLTQVVFNTAGTITNSVAATTSRLTVDGAAGTNDTTYSGTLTDGAGIVALAKTGSSTLTLTNGLSTYSGGTTVEGGRLLASNTSGSATGTGDVTVNSGGTFGGTGLITGSVITTSGSFLSPGASIESLTIGGASGAGTLVIEYDGAAGTPIDYLSVTGALSIASMNLDVQMLSGGAALTAPAYVFADYATLTGTFASANLPAGYAVDYNYSGLNQIALVQIPEPAAASLGALAAALLLRRRRIA